MIMERKRKTSLKIHVGLRRRKKIVLYIYIYIVEEIVTESLEILNVAEVEEKEKENILAVFKIFINL